MVDRGESLGENLAWASARALLVLSFVAELLLLTRVAACEQAEAAHHDRWERCSACRRYCGPGVCCALRRSLWLSRHAFEDTHLGKLASARCLAHDAASTVAQKLSLCEQAATYQSDVASRQDLNSYFDNENKVAKKAHRKDFTSEAAKQQLSAIFGSSKADRMSATVKHMQKKLVTQDLAYSAKDANSDLDSYFDSMQETNVRANRAHARKETSVDDDGLPVLTSQKSKQQQEDAAVNKEELENYKKNNPDFKKRMDTVVLALW